MSIDIVFPLVNTNNTRLVSYLPVSFKTTVPLDKKGQPVITKVSVSIKISKPSID